MQVGTGQVSKAGRRRWDGALGFLSCERDQEPREEPEKERKLGEALRRTGRRMGKGSRWDGASHGPGQASQGPGTRAPPMRSAEPARREEASEPPDTGSREAGGGAGRAWKGAASERGPREEGRGGVGAGSRRRPDRDRFLPEGRPPRDPGADRGRRRAEDGEVPRPRSRPSLAAAALQAPPPAGPAPGGRGSGRRGARAGPGAPATGWQPRSGRVAAAAVPPPPPPPPAAPPAAAAGRSFTPERRSEALDPEPLGERGRRLQPAAGWAPGALRTPARRQRALGGQRPGLGAPRRRRGGGEPRTRAPRRSRSSSARVGAGQPRWPCAPAARG